jgi:hypothetical protein
MTARWRATFTACLVAWGCSSSTGPADAPAEEGGDATLDAVLEVAPDGITDSGDDEADDEIESADAPVIDTEPADAEVVDAETETVEEDTGLVDTTGDEEPGDGPAAETTPDADDVSIDMATEVEPPPFQPCQRYDELLADLGTAGAGGHESLVAAFRQDVEADAANRRVAPWPIKCGATFVAFFEAAGATTANLAGTFNGWSMTATPCAKAGATGWWHCPVTAPAADSYAYKVVRDGGYWMMDPSNRRFEYALLNGNTILNSVVNLAGSGKGHLERFPAFHADRLGNDRALTLYLPPGYEESQDEYPVLYMHDGQNVYDDANSGFGNGGWEVNVAQEALLAQGLVRPFIVAALDNAGNDRKAEFVDDKKPMYADLVIGQAVPFVDATYRTLAEKAGRVLMGSSYGGIISFWITYGYDAADYGYGTATGASTFAKAGCLSPSFETYDQAFVKLVTAFKPVAYYLDSGGGPGHVDDYEDTIAMRDAMLANGWALDTDLWYWWDQDAPHNEAAWRARLPIPLKLLFPPA